MPNALEYVPDQCKAQEMRAEAVHIGPYVLKSVPDQLRLKGCARVAPNHFKNQ